MANNISIVENSDSERIAKIFKSKDKLSLEDMMQIIDLSKGVSPKNKSILAGEVPNDTLVHPCDEEKICRRVFLSCLKTIPLSCFERLSKIPNACGSFKDSVANNFLVTSFREEIESMGFYASKENTCAIYQSLKQQFIGRHFDVYSKWAQSIVLHTFMLSRVKSFTDATLVVLAFLDANTDGPLINLDRSQYLMVKAKKICDMFISSKDFDENNNNNENALEEQALSFDNFSFASLKEGAAIGLKGTKAFIKNYSAFKESGVYKRVYKLCTYLMCVSVCEKFNIKMSDWGFSLLEEKAMKRKFFLTPDFMVCLVDTLIFVCETGVQCFQTGSIDPIFHSGDSYLGWYEKTLDLQRRKLTISSSDNSSALPNFLGDLEEVIEKGESICKYATSAAEKRCVLSTLNALRIMRDEFIGVAASSQMRQAPFSILLYGDSGIGKSSILNLLYQHFAKVRGLSSEDKFRYTMNPIAKYWDNFQTYQWAIVLDDIAALKPDKCSELEPSLAQVLMVNNIIPYTPDQAALEKKGKTPLRAKFVVATTNKKNLNANSFFNCPSAIQRRFPYVIVPTVKEQYSSGGRLDSTLCGEVTDYPDFWTWSVEKVVTRSVVDHTVGESKNCYYDKILCNVDLSTFLKWFNRAVEAHFIDQDLTTSNNNMVKDVKLCSCCKLPPSMCAFVKAAHSMSGSITDKREIPTSFIEITEFPEINDCDSVESYGIDISGLEIQSMTRTEGFINIFKNYMWPFMEWLYIHQDGIAIFFILWSVYYLRNVVWVFVFIFLFIKMNFIQYNKVVDNFSLPRRIYRQYIRFRISQPNCSVEDFKKFYKHLGDEAARRIKYPVVLLSITTIIGSILVLKKLFASSNYYDEQGLTSSKHSEYVQPKPDGDEKENPWKKDDFSLTTFDVSPESCSWKAMNKEKLCQLIKNNCVRFVMKGSDGIIRETNGFCVTQQLYVFNLHTFEGWDKAVVLISATHDLEGVGDKVKVVFDRKLMMCLDKQDLAFVNIANLPPRKDLTKFFCKESYRGSAHGFYVGRDPAFKIKMRDVQYISLKIVDKLSIKTQPSWTGFVSEPTINGDCGSILIMTTHFGPVFGGIHSLGGAGGDIVSSRITFELLKDIVLPHFDSKLQCSEPKLSAPSKKRFLAGLHDKATVRFIKEGTASTFGSFLDRSVPKHSMVCKTPFFKSLYAMGFEDKYTRPQLRGWVPQRHALLDLSDIASGFDPYILEQAADSFYDDISLLLPKQEIAQLGVYDIFTATNGAAGVAYVDKMNRNTSTGCPWKTSKKKFLVELDPQRDLQEPVEFDAEVLDRVEEMRQEYMVGQRCQPVFCANLKDEPVSYEKAKDGKTRVFMGAPVDFSIVMRQYFLSAVRLIQRNRFIFEAAPGTNACSKEWDDFYKYLTQFGTDRMVAGDFKKFDKRMPANFILAAFSILTRICESSGNFSQWDIRIMRGIAYDVAFPVCDYFGTLMMFYGSNPSGHPLTVIINCIVNSLYMRYCYIVANPLNECFTFKENVALMTYGDDNVMGVSKKIDWFDHTAIQAVLKACGVTYTMADKSERSIPFINMEEVTFLKRYWRRLPEIPFMVAPLEIASLEKSLMTWTRSKSITEGEQMIAVIDSALQGFALWGREKYESMSYILKELCLLHGYHLAGDLERVFKNYDTQLLAIFGSAVRVKGLLSDLNQNVPISDSDCTNDDNVLLQEVSENGSDIEVHQGVPQSPYLGKIASTVDTCSEDELFFMDLS